MGVLYYHDRIFTKKFIVFLFIWYEQYNRDGYTIYFLFMRHIFFVLKKYVMYIVEMGLFCLLRCFKMLMFTGFILYLMVDNDLSIELRQLRG